MTAGHFRWFFIGAKSKNPIDIGSIIGLDSLQPSQGLCHVGVRQRSIHIHRITNQCGIGLTE